MPFNIFSEGFRWERYLAWARLLLALVVVGREIASPPHLSFFYSLAIVAFLCYGALLVAFRNLRGGTLGLLALFADTVFFLIVTNHGTVHSVIWFPAVFYLYLLTEAIAFYGPREVATVVAISVGFCAVASALGPPRPQLVLLLRCIVVGGAVAIAAAVMKRRFETRVADLTKELEWTRAAGRKSGEAERQKMASDFHDGPLQSFISLQMRLEILRRLLERDREAGMHELEQLQTLAVGQIRELRAFIHGLRGPVDVDAANLFVSARRIAENFQKEAGISVTFVGSDTPLAVAPEAATELLQVLREALNNVRKHAHATRVAIALETTGSDMEMSIDDNGQGFPFSGVYNLEELDLLRLGPASIKRRARTLNADLTLESRPGRGAGLRIRVAL